MQNIQFTVNNWSLVVPPALTILDDPNPAYKTRGCQILHMVLLQTPPQFILVRGLTDLFWESLLACLSYLPFGTSNITLEESIHLLNESYDALITLASIRAQDIGSKTAISNLSAANGNVGLSSPEYKLKYAKYLGQILVEGIYHVISISGEQVRIAQLLVQKLGVIASNMKIYFVIHLQNSIKMLINILSDPFITAYPPLLVTTLDTLDIIIENTAPRISIYKFQILKGLLVSWKKTCESDEHGTNLDNVKKKLYATAKLLKTKTTLGDVEAEKNWGEIVAAVEDLGPTYVGLL